MKLTQIELDQIKQQISYDPETGEFTYTSDRLLPRRHQKEMAVPPPPKVAHRAGDRADKVYGGQFIGVYVLSKALNAAHVALFLVTGHWPEAVHYRDGNWRNIRQSNLEPRTRSQQTTEAAQARYCEHARQLPPNVYALSDGQYIGKRGKFKTRHYKTIEEVESAMSRDRWLSL